MSDTAIIVAEADCGCIVAGCTQNSPRRRDFEREQQSQGYRVRILNDRGVLPTFVRCSKHRELSSFAWRDAMDQFKRCRKCGEVKPKINRGLIHAGTKLVFCDDPIHTFPVKKVEWVVGIDPSPVQKVETYGITKIVDGTTRYENAIEVHTSSSDRDDIIDFLNTREAANG